MNKNCYACNKPNLTKEEVGITKKLLGDKSSYFYCLSCLAESLDVDIDFLKEKIAEYKDSGCEMF